MMFFVVNCVKSICQYVIVFIQLLLNFPTVFRGKFPKSTVLTFIFAQLVFSASATNWYVTPTGGGSFSGINWNNAFAATNTAITTGVSAGDTVWYAGGYYSYGDANTLPYITISNSGTAANWIYYKRATTGDTACTSAAGWTNSFDTNIIMYAGNNSLIYWKLPIAGSYIWIDGRTWSGWKLITNTNTYNGGVSIDDGQHDGSVSNIVFANLELIGMNYWSNPTNAALCPAIGDSAFSLYPGYNSTDWESLITITNCNIHGFFNTIFFGGYKNRLSGLIIDHCKLYNSGATTANHCEVFYNNAMAGPLVIRYCEVWDWSSEGIWNYYTNTSPVYIYGNVFHDKGPNSDPNGVNDYDGTGVGPATHYCVNNTFFNLNNTLFGKTNGFVIGATSLFENNLFVNCTYEYKVGTVTAVAPPGTWDYNYANTAILNRYSLGIDANSINNSGVNPLINPGIGGNFNIVSNIGSAYPRNKGIIINNVVDPVLGMIDFSKDPNGNTRGADGAWDIGAYEYTSAATNVGSTFPSISVSPQLLAFGSVPASTSVTNSFKVQNIGGGTLTGTANVSAPFNIVSGGTYSLVGNQTQTVTVSYTPDGAPTNYGTILFNESNGSVTNASVMGSVILPPPSGLNVFF
jgi:hypothetical protein